MALSTCAKCGGFDFEVVRKRPVGSAVELRFVQCAYCGLVVGVLESAATETPAANEKDSSK